MLRPQKAAVFAGIGLSALQLPNMDDVHWITRAFLSTSMALGMLSVTCATCLLQNIIMCSTPLEVRLWLSTGRAQDELRSRYKGQEDIACLPLESSVSAAMMCELPAQLLWYAVILFFTGFAVYLLSCWVHHVEEDLVRHTSTRDVFIFLMTTAGFFGLKVVYGVAMRSLDAVSRDTRFKHGALRYGVCCEEEENLNLLKIELRKWGWIDRGETENSVIDDKVGQISQQWKERLTDIQAVKFAGESP